MKPLKMTSTIPARVRRRAPAGVSPSTKMYPHGYYIGGDVDKYRLGAVSFGYKNYRVGVNTENARHAFQNQLAHHLIIPQPSFKVLDFNWYPYYNWGTNSKYSLWY